MQISPGFANAVVDPSDPPISTTATVAIDVLSQVLLDRGKRVRQADAIRFPFLGKPLQMERWGESGPNIRTSDPGDCGVEVETPGQALRC